MKKIFAAFFVLLSIAMFSCKKSSDSTPGLSNDTNYVIPDSNSTKSYYPIAIGNFWRYKHFSGSSDSVGKLDTFKLTVAKDSIVAKDTFRILKDSLNKYNFTYWQVKDTFYRKGVLPSIISNIGDYNEKYFINNIKVDSSWTQQATLNVGGFPAKANMKYTIKYLDSTVTIYGKKYPHTAYVKLDISSTGTSGYGDIYYSRGFGLVKYTIAVPNLSIYEKAELLDSYVK